MIIKIIVFGTLIFAAFRLLVFLGKKAGFSKAVKHHLNYILSIIELLVWLAFLTWVSKLVYAGRDQAILYFAAVALALLIVPAFIFIRDFVFGIFLKVQQKVIEGTFIELEDIKGEIVKAGQFFLNIQDQHGTIKSLGYYKVNSRVISVSGYQTLLERLVLEFSFPGSIRINETIENLNYLLLNTPWVAASKVPIVEEVSTEAETTVVRMAVFVIHKSYRENILEMVNQHLSESGSIQKSADVAR